MPSILLQLQHIWYNVRSLKSSPRIPFVAKFTDLLERTFDVIFGKHVIVC
jgi:hypothetical protein